MSEGVWGKGGDQKACEKSRDKVREKSREKGVEIARKKPHATHVQTPQKIDVWRIFFSRKFHAPNFQFHEPYLQMFHASYFQIVHVCCCLSCSYHHHLAGHDPV